LCAATRIAGNLKSISQAYIQILRSQPAVFFRRQIFSHKKRQKPLSKMFYLNKVSAK
jgi:hypothetical protein